MKYPPSLLDERAETVASPCCSMETWKVILFLVLSHESLYLLYRRSGVKSVFRSVHAVVDEFSDSRGGNMHASICRSIVDEYAIIFTMKSVSMFAISDPSIRKSYVHDIAEVFVALRNEEESSRACDEFCRVFKAGHIEIEHIAETIGSGSHAVSEVQPSAVGFDRMWSLTILDRKSVV